ncbi:MAG: hypothetical protein AABP62_31685 [Planctomycetota bacterium]
MQRILNLAIVLVCLSCSTAPTVPVFQVRVSSLVDPDRTPGRSYVLLPSAEGIDLEDLQFREFARYVAGALERQGFTRAPDFSKADVAVFLAYGIGDPQLQTYTYTVPVYGQTGGGTSTLNLSTYGAGGYSTTSGTITTLPRYGPVGSQSVTQSNVTYFRYLFLDAIDLRAFRESQKVLSVWRTNVTSNGSSGDLRLVLPILVAASEQYIAVNTGKQVEVDLREGDPRVQKVRGHNTP